MVRRLVVNVVVIVIATTEAEVEVDSFVIKS